MPTDVKKNNYRQQIKHLEERKITGFDTALKSTSSNCHCDFFPSILRLALVKTKKTEWMSDFLSVKYSVSKCNVKENSVNKL